MSEFGVQDEIMFRIHARIVTEGLYVDYVFGSDDSPPWAYTIGLMELGHAEVIMFGLDASGTADTLQCLFDEIAAGTTRPVGRNRRQAHLGDAGLPVRLVPVADQHWECAGSHFLCLAAGYHQAMGRARAELRALQLVYGSKSGKFPWHAGASPRDKRRQPLLDRGLRAV